MFPIRGGRVRVAAWLPGCGWRRVVARPGLIHVRRPETAVSRELRRGARLAPIFRPCWPLRGRGAAANTVLVPPGAIRPARFRCHHAAAPERPPGGRQTGVPGHCSDRCPICLPAAACVGPIASRETSQGALGWAIAPMFRCACGRGQGHRNTGHRNTRASRCCGRAASRRPAGPPAADQPAGPLSWANARWPAGGAPRCPGNGRTPGRAGTRALDLSALDILGSLAARGGDTTRRRRA
jgi:hypothetical protein